MPHCDKTPPVKKYSALLPITLIVFVDVLGFTIVIPLLPFYAEHLGATPAAIGALVSVYAVCSLVAAPFLGRWSDRIGRKPVLLLSQFGTLAGFVMLALAPSLTWVFAARALDGITAGNVATARAYISDVTAPKERTQAFGLIAAAFSFGYLIGPAGAGMLSHYGQEVPLWIAAILSATSILATQFLLPSAEPPARSPGPTTDDSPLRFLTMPGVGVRLWQIFAFLLAFSCFTSGFALFCERRLHWNGAPFGTSEVGLVLAYVGLLGLVMQLGLLRPLVTRFGEAALVWRSFIVGALAYIALGFVHSLPSLLLCLTFSGLANSLLRPCLLGLISLQVAPNQQGAVSGLTQSLQSLAMIAGPLIAGGLIEIGWLQGWALACALTLLTALSLPYWKK